MSRGLATPSRLDRIDSAGLRAQVYTVNALQEARRLFEMGVWGIFTDYPDRISPATLPVPV